jgi:pimeloyl-ACP methyl ester carboxylesterase
MTILSPLNATWQATESAGSPRLTFIGFQTSNDPAAERQLMALADASGGRLVSADDASALTTALQGGMSASSSLMAGGGGGGRTAESGAGWVIAVVLMNALLLLALFAAWRWRRLRVAKEGGGRRRRTTRGRWFVAIVLMTHATAASLGSATTQRYPMVASAVAVSPVLLIHGFNGSEDSFGDLASALVARGWLDLPPLTFNARGELSCILSTLGGIVVPPRAVGTAADCASPGCILARSSQRFGSSIAECVPWAEGAQRIVQDRRVSPGKVLLRLRFAESRTLSFEEQGAYVAQASRLLRQVTGAGEVRLMGHSMGGLAARAFVQSAVYDGSVRELFTVATPHLGSLLPHINRDVIGELELPCPRRVRLFKSLFLDRLGFPEEIAIQRLGAASPELLALNFGRGDWRGLPRDIRYVNVVADGRDDVEGCTAEVLAALGPQVGADYARLRDALGATVSAADLMALASVELLVKMSDLVVPVVSQTMRLAPVAQSLPLEEVVVEANHMSVTGVRELVDLLDASPIEPPKVTGDIDDVLLLMDLSSSMQERDKIAMAKEALHAVTNGLEAATRVALVEFGRIDCSIEPYDLGTDRAALRARIDAMAATGRTPLLLAMEQAAYAVRTLPAPERVAVVVVSDGMDTCSRGADPVAVARELGIALRIIRG